MTRVPEKPSAGLAVLLINSLGTGGAERAVATAARELQRRGHDARILCLESPPEGASTPVVAPEALSRMRASAGPLLKLAALPVLAFRLSRYVARERVPVVMSHLFRANFVNVLSRVIWRASHRVIVVNHTRLSRLRSEGLQGRINGILSRRLYPKADCVASVSVGASRETARVLGLAPDRCTALHDPIDCSAAAKAAIAASASDAVVAVGRLVPLKRFEDLVDAFSRIAGDFPGLELRLVGDGPSRAALQQRAQKSPARERIRFLGMLSDPLPAVAGCRAFVSTSGTEGFGMAIVEALAAGVPVIASDCAYGPREILSPGSNPETFLALDARFELAPCGILFPVGSVNALESALRFLLQDGALRSRLSAAGPVRAADFSVERSVSAYENQLFLRA